MAGFTLKDMQHFQRGTRQVVRTGARMGGVARDELIKTKKGVAYNVWGNEVAFLPRKSNRVYVSHAGYHTNLTRDRLNKVLPSGSVRIRKGQMQYLAPSGKKLPMPRWMRFNF